MCIYLIKIIFVHILCSLGSTKLFLQILYSKITRHPLTFPYPNLDYCFRFTKRLNLSDPACPPTNNMVIISQPIIGCPTNVFSICHLRVLHLTASYHTLLNIISSPRDSAQMRQVVTVLATRGMEV